MRKINLFSAAVLLALGASVASCSDESGLVDNSKVEVPELKGEQEVVLKVASAGDGLVSRAGRPLYSSEAAQKIDKVKIVIVKCTPDAPGTYTVVASKLIEDWMNVSQDYATGGHGKQYTWRLGADEKLQYVESSQDTYMVYAIGYTNAGLYKTSLGNFENLTTGDFNWVSSALTAENLKDLDLGEEVFAGSLENLEIDKDGSFTITTGGENVLTLHRQVSGITGYFTNVPTFPAGSQDKVLNADSEKYNDYIQGLKLQLVSSNANDQIIFAGFNSSFQETGKDVKYIVNGSQSGEWDTKVKGITEFKTAFSDGSTPAYKIYEISLGAWFPQGDTSKDGYLGTLDAYNADGSPNDNWVSPYGSGNTVDFQPGSVFAGKFVIPFTKVPNTKTLELQLVATRELPATASTGDASSLADSPIVAANTIIKSWRINLSSSDEQLGTTNASNHVEVVQQNGIPAVFNGNNYEEKFDSYSIVRNHLYGVGVKSTDGYDPDKDKPEDLSKGQTLILKVNDNWELIHKMEIE